MYDDDQWCFTECLQCGRVLDAAAASFCSQSCEQDAAIVHDNDDQDDFDEVDSSWQRVSLWVKTIDRTPPPASPTYISPSKRILSRQFPTACLTSDSPVSSKPNPSSPRPARTPTATESLVASSQNASPVSLAGLVRSWAPRPPRPQLPRLTTTHFTVFAKSHGYPPKAPQLLPSDDSLSDGDVSPVWWSSHKDPDTATSASSAASPCILIRHTPATRGRRYARVDA